MSPDMYFFLLQCYLYSTTCATLGRWAFVSFCSAARSSPSRKPKHELLSAAPSVLQIPALRPTVSSPPHDCPCSTRPNYFWVPTHAISSRVCWCLHTAPSQGALLFHQQPPAPRNSGGKTLRHFLGNARLTSQVSLPAPSFALLLPLAFSSGLFQHFPHRWVTI